MKTLILVLFVLNVAFAFIPENHIYIRMLNSFAAGALFTNIVNYIIDEWS